MSYLPEDAVVDRMAELRRAGIPFVTATVIGTRGSCPRKAGAKMVIAADGRTFGTVGGGAVESRIVEKGRALLADPRVERFEWNLASADAGEMLCGGRMEFLLEPFCTGPSALVFGAGHVGRALFGVFALLGFRVTMVDERESLLSEDVFPGARLVHDRPDKAAAELDVGAGDYCVIANPTHELDRETLFALVHREPAYIGLMASKRKRRDIFRDLAERGVPDEALDKVHCPVGLDIGSQTPAEIAVSIAAEIIAVMRGKGRVSP